jgi:hypothetical protein
MSYSLTIELVSTGFFSQQTITGYTGTPTGILTVPSNVQHIGNNVFKNCTDISQIVIDGASTGCSIGNSAFEGCTGLVSIILSDYVNSIGDRAFAGCTGLTNFTKESGSLGWIGMNAFNGCTQLTAVVLPTSTVIVYNYGAFNNCTSLESIVCAPF